MTAQPPTCGWRIPLAPGVSTTCALPLLHWGEHSNHIPAPMPDTPTTTWPTQAEKSELYDVPPELLPGVPGARNADEEAMAVIARQVAAREAAAEQRGAEQALRAAVVELRDAARDADGADEAQMFSGCADWLARAAAVASGP